MLENRKKQFTIGQFAALHQINKKTLMWYDEIGLFRPAIKKENGYRYYTYQQSFTLKTILMLRELNVSIPEIQELMLDHSSEKLSFLFGEKIKELDQRISHLKEIQKTLEYHQKTIVGLTKADLSKISITEKEEEYLAMVNINHQTSLEQEVTTMVEEMKKHPLCWLHNATYGSMIPVERLYQGKWEEYSALFVVVPNVTEQSEIRIKPKGLYLTAYCKGNWDKIPQRYREILAYAQKHNLILNGYAYETGINEIAIHTMEEYITKIEIPVQLK